MPVVAVERRADLESQFLRPKAKVEELDSSGLRPEQSDAIRGHRNIGIAFTGGLGNLVRVGFVKDGMRQIVDALGSNPFECVMVGSNNLKWDKVPDFTSGGYVLHPTYGVLSRKAFEKCVGEIGLKLLVSATPTRIHLDDVDLAVANNLDGHIEKPAYRVTHAQAERNRMLEAVQGGRIKLIDFFYYSDPIVEFFMNMDKYMEGLGEVTAVRATCLEPHSVLTESGGTRWKMLFDEDVNGGTLGADQQPHPLVMISGFLKRKFGIDLKPENIDTVFRAMDAEVLAKAHDEQIRLPHLSETTMVISGKVTPPGGRPITIESINGKGLEVSGSNKRVPLPTYILEIECEKGTIKVGLGDLQGGCAPHISIIPKNESVAPRVIVFRNGGNGYKLCLADAVAKALGSTDPLIEGRLDEQTQASFAALDVLADLRTRMLENADFGRAHYYYGAQNLALPSHIRVPFVDAWMDYTPPVTSTLLKG